MHFHLLAKRKATAADLDHSNTHCYKHGLLQPSTVESRIKESCLIHAMKA